MNNNKFSDISQLPPHMQETLKNSTQIDTQALSRGTANLPSLDLPNVQKNNVDDQLIIDQLTNQINAVDSHLKEEIGQQQYDSMARQQEQYTQTAPVQQQLHANPTQASQKNKTVRTVHPLLNRLKQKFGIDTIGYFYFDLDDMKLAFAPLTEETKSIAYDIVKVAYSSGVATDWDVIQFTDMLNTAKVAVSVLAIDNIPLWQMFDLHLDPKFKTILEAFVQLPNSNVLNPPLMIREQQAIMMFDFLFRTLDPKVVDKMKTFFSDTVESNGGNKYKLTFKFVCPECGSTSEEETVRRNSDDTLQPYYCKYDGVAMELHGDTDEEGNKPSPLV